MHIDLLVRRMVKMLYFRVIFPLDRVRINLNDLKTVISISVTKSVPDTLQLWKRNCGKMGKSHGKWYFD